MKRILCILATALLFVEGFSQTLSSFAAGKRLTMKYSVNYVSGKKSFSGSGTVVYQDGAYSLVSDVFRVYNDRNTLWTIDYGAKEALAEPGRDEDLLSHPEIVLSMFDMNMKGANASPLFQEDGTPKGVNITLKNGDVIALRFDSVTLTPAGSLDDFSFDSSTLDSSWIFTDMR